MFNSFGEYMFRLLFGPLRKVTKKANQFYIFFKVIGRQFDQMKKDIFRVREESAVLTCSDIMLPVHGQDRDMARLKGETIESYRTRLAMKGVISEKAGLNEGIRYLAKSFGYDNVEILKNPDPEHWAEATVFFFFFNIVLDDHGVLLQELNKIKPARTLLSLSKQQRYPGTAYLGAARVSGRIVIIEQE